jgi:hypothetical protein
VAENGFWKPLALLRCGIAVAAAVHLERLRDVGSHPLSDAIIVWAAVPPDCDSQVARPRPSVQAMRATAFTREQ